MKLLLHLFVRSMVVVLLLVAMVEATLAQSATAADLNGVIKDESGAVITGATVTVRNPQNNFERVVTTDETGVYRFLSIPPGDYLLTAESPGFSKLINENLVLTLGQAARLDLTLMVAGQTGEKTVFAESSDMVETSRTAVTQTIDRQRIENLPINGRNFLNFTLTSSQILRDNSRPTGAAPTTGLVFNGQGERFNLVQIDGADNMDRSINSARATVSQEAVQEFQVIINSFSAEFGHTGGGVVNIITRSGTNDLHGNAFGFIRHRSIQARNALAFPPLGNDSKPAFTRGQYGFTLGGPVKRDKAFFFLSLDQTQRHESGFSQIGLNPSLFELTAAQQAFIAANSGSPIGNLYKTLATSGAQVAKTGIDPLSGKPIFFLTSMLSGGQLGAIPQSFRTLTNVQNVYPVSDEFTFYSAKLDYQLNQDNQLTVRYSFTPTATSGLLSTTQSQAGLTDVSRTGTASFRDTSLLVQDLQTLGSNKINEFIFNFGRRGASLISSPNVGIGISGAAIFGAEPFSPINRIERRYEFKDNFTYATGNHTIQFGGDFNRVELDKVSAGINFSGQFNFGEIPLAALSPLFAGAPPLTPVQAYGLGIPQSFIQGFGRPLSEVTSKTIGLYGQDSWKIRPNITLNYGVRYDIEFISTFRPVGITTDRLSLTAEQLDAAERFLNVMQGIPTDNNNVAPRIAVAWDPKGDGKMVVRAAYGLFYDRPLLGLVSVSDIADGTQSPQLIVTGGNPLPNNPLNAAQIFQGTIVPGVTPGLDRSAVYLPGQSRFNPSAGFPGYGLILPFTLPIDRDFAYAYTNQANLSVEREVARDLSLNVTYIFSGGRKITNQYDRNTPNTKMILQASPSGTPNAVTIANNFFRPSGPNPVLIKTDRPIPFGSVLAQESSGSSAYHALSVNLTKRFSNNLQALVSYTFGKTMDRTSQPQDTANQRADHALSNNDQRHRFVLSAIFKSPYKQQSSRGLKKVLSNYTISPIIELSSGRPFNILSGADTNLNQTSNDRPDVDASGRLTVPRLGQSGTLGRNTGTSPGFASVDLRVARQVPIGERIKVDLIAEVFNLFNRVNVSSVNTNFRFVSFDEGQFKSTPTGVFDPRQFQFAVKINF